MAADDVFRFGTIVKIMLRVRLATTLALVASCVLNSCAAAPHAAPVALTGTGLSATLYPAVENSTPTAGTARESQVVTLGATAAATSPPDLAATPGIATQRTSAGSPGSPTDPLTGLVVSDAGLMERRPLAIKISNYPRAIRPQYGLNLADVVYEYYIEWLNTRFIAIFYGNNAEQIGPVRSGRYFDEHITRMYHAYYVFNYADPREYAYFLGADLAQFLVVPGYGSCPPFFQSRVTSLITDTRHFETYFDSTRFSACLVHNGHDNSAQTLRDGFFRFQPPADGSPVDRIFTHYSRCDYNYWEYDAALQRYRRFQETSPNPTPQHIDDCADSPETYAPLMDASVHEQVSSDNIVVLFVAHTFANQSEQDDEIYHINLIDSGQAFVFRDGVALPARWLRTDIDQPLLITTPSGSPIYLKPGRTFYQVIGETSTAWSDAKDWHFDFHTP